MFRIRTTCHLRKRGTLWKPSLPPTHPLLYTVESTIGRTDHGDMLRFPSMSSLESKEKDFLDGLPIIDQRNVGEKVGTGAQHVVYTYSHGNILKLPRAAVSQDLFSRTISPMTTQTTDELRRDYALCMDYFPGFTVPAEIIEHTRSDLYCILQKRIAMRNLTRDDCRRTSPIREEMEEILRQNTALGHDHHVWFDFMGWNPQKFFRGPYIDNITVRQEPKEKHLALFDYTLFPLPSFSFKGVRNWILYHAQRTNMQRFGLRW